MAGKPPKLCFDLLDKPEGVESGLDQLNDWCILQGWRDAVKEPDDRDHWKAENYAPEISAFRLALPTDVWRIVKSSLFPMMATTGESSTKETYRGYPWVWQTFLSAHYSTQDNILSGRMTFLENNIPDDFVLPQNRECTAINAEDEIICLGLP